MYNVYINNPGHMTKMATSSIYIYIFITIALDESIFLGVLHFPMKNIKSRDQKGNAYGRGGVITSQ